MTDWLWGVFWEREDASFVVEDYETAEKAYYYYEKKATVAGVSFLLLLFIVFFVLWIGLG